MEPSHDSQTIRVGPDCVILRDGIVYIYARRRFGDWTVREFSRQVIFFQDRKYYLRLQAEAPRPYAVRYELAPWPENLHEHSKQSYVYDREAVAERDGMAFREGAHSLQRACLLPLYPFLGFCWSGFKERDLVPLGFVPRSITSASVMLQCCLLVLDGVFFGFLGGGIVSQVLSASILRPGSYEGSAVLVDLGLLVLLSLDCAIRYNQILRGDESPDGLLEWLFKLGRRRPTPLG